MCNIVGYIGHRTVSSLLIEGLKELEYRGYDSSGIAILNGKQCDIFKAVGKIENLEKKVKKIRRSLKKDVTNIGIGHTF